MKRKTGIPAIPAPGEAKRGPQGHLGYLLRQAGVALRGAMDRALADLGVTTPQFAVLTMIVAYPGISGADLARLTFLTPQTINVIVRNLARDGAIAKTAHTTHGRILRLQATPKGERLLKRCRSGVAEIEVEMARRLDRKEERVVRRWLAGLPAALGRA